LSKTIYLMHVKYLMWALIDLQQGTVFRSSPTRVILYNDTLSLTDR